MKLMDIDADTLNIPETEYDVRVTMLSSEFSRIVRDLSQLGESVRIEVSKEGVRFASDGEAANGSVLLRQSDGSHITGNTIKPEETDGKEKDDAEGDGEVEVVGEAEGSGSGGSKKTKVKKEKGDDDVEMDEEDKNDDEEEFKPTEEGEGEEEQEQDEEDEDGEGSGSKKRKKKVYVNLKNPIVVC
jgi:proliferating cell nuclear antigen